MDAISTNTFLELFERQQAHQFQVANTTPKQRIAKLDGLLKALLRYRKEIQQALQADFQKPPLETDLTEIYVVTSEIKHACRNLRRWMKAKRVPTPLPLLGSRSWIRYEPKGVCLILAPWNFPVQLTFNPLVSAIAAGNTVILKPSEHTPHATAIMKKIVEELFPPEEVALVEGAAETAQELLQLPFNHIFFTGSPRIGKLVMQAAARHLSSVTLELGGKSPTIIDESADISTAVRRIIWGKFTNSGQICLAPDYVLVHERKKQALLEAFAQQLEAAYGKDALQSPDYARMVNAGHFARANDNLQEALKNGAQLEYGGQTEVRQNFIAPTVLSEVDNNSRLMQEEIFAPILPIQTFRTIEEAISIIREKPRPLGLYIYSRSNRNIDQVIAQTRAGGTCINHNLIHYGNKDLPFGGVNNSGIGKSHGWFGFEAFSNARAVTRQFTLGTADFFMPPYSALKERLIYWTTRRL